MKRLVFAILLVFSGVNYVPVAVAYDCNECNCGGNNGDAWWCDPGQGCCD